MDGPGRPHDDDHFSDRRQALRRQGPRITLTVGALVIALGYGISLPLIGNGSALGLLAVTIVCSTGVGFAYGAMPALIMGAVPQSETASANSFNTLMRSIGSSVSAAVMAVVLAQMTTKFGPVSCRPKAASVSPC